MTQLEQASRDALRAIEGGDLDALAVALASRRSAIADGDPATPEVLNEGEQVKNLLENIILEARQKHARLDQIQRGFALDLPLDPHLTFRG